MPGNKCQFILCGKSSSKFPGLKMFRFPKDERKELWKINSGNDKLFHIDEQTLHNRYVCQEHFSPESFMSAKMEKLNRFAIPYKYNESFKQPSSSVESDVNRANDCSEKELSPPTTILSSPFNTFSGPSSPIKPEDFVVCDLIEMSSSRATILNVNNTNHAPRKRKSKQVIKCRQKKRCNKAFCNSKFTKNINKIKSRNTLKYLLNTHKFSKAIVTMQFKNNRRPWTLAERNLALSLFYKSPSVYAFLRQQNVILPAPLTVRHWIGQLKCLPGFSKMYFGHLRRKFEFKSYMEKACCICFDQISIKEFLEYSKEYDFIEGYADLGTPDGRTRDNAITALVVMARGIYTSWEIPISYYLLSSSSSKCIVLTDSIIISILQRIVDVGMKPRIIVCNQNTNDSSRPQALGTTEEKPYFVLGEEQLYVIYDTSHLLYSLWDNLIGSTFKKGDTIISHSDIIDTYIKKESTITDGKIQPDSSRQLIKVELAAQVFNSSMVLAMRTCIAMGELESKTAKDTADFIEFINKLFDCLNCKTLFSDNAYNRASLDTSEVNKFLSSALDYFKNLIKSTNGQITRPLCFRGFIHTINGVRQFFECEKKRGIKFLPMNRLNQDCLDNLFHTIRQKGGRCKKPSARTIRTSFKRSCISSLCASEQNNCDINQESNDSAKMTENKLCTQNKNTVDQIADSTNASSSTSHHSTTEEIIKPIVFEDCLVKYFASYLAYSCINKFKCENCKFNLTTSTNLNDKNQLLLLNKNYTNIKSETELMAPLDNFHIVIVRALSIFENKFEYIQHKKKIKTKLMNILKKDNLISNWLLDDGKTCLQHRIFILEKCLTCTICRKIKIFSSARTNET